MRVTMVMECPVDRALHPESATPAERAEADRQNFESNPDHLRKLLENREAIRSVRVTAVVVE